MIVPIFLPHMGCKKRCIFCDQKYITEKDDYDLKEHIEKSLGSIHSTFEIGLYGGDIFGLQKEKLKSILEHFEPFLEKIERIRVSAKPARINDELIDIIDLLKTYKVQVVELGIPTFNDLILDLLNRGHTVKDLEEIYVYLRREGFKVALQVMVGLPHETDSDIRNTVRYILKLKPDYIRIYPLVIIKGTPIASMISEGMIKLVEFDEAVKRAAFIYVNAVNHEIDVIKIGLTDNKTLRENVVGGFFHPSFGYLVRCHIFFVALRDALVPDYIGKLVTLQIYEKDLPYISGYRGENLRYFKEKGIQIKILPTDLKPWEFVVSDEKGSENKKNAIKVFSSLCLTE
ncbi:MAG: radical SAM protein [Deltaproteobacteria bacterium]|nr:radical SAM protein [Deltaproteobacteria bacterium]